MIEVRCKICNTELKSHQTQTRCCGCTNMMTVVGDKITALDLSKVVMVNNFQLKSTNNYLSDEDMMFQEERRNRDFRRLEFEVR